MTDFLEEPDEGDTVHAAVIPELSGNAAEPYGSSALCGRLPSIVEQNVWTEGNPDLVTCPACLTKLAARTPPATSKAAEERYERAARALYRQFSIYGNTWETLTHDTRDKWRDAARRILDEADDGIVRPNPST